DTVIHKVGQKSDTLRTSPGISISDAGDLFPLSFILPPKRGERQKGVIGRSQRIQFAFRIFHLGTQERNQVAHDGESQAKNQRILCRINKLVDMAGFETGRKIEILRASADVFSVRLSTLVACGKLPLSVVDGDPGAVAVLSDGESCQRFVEGCRCVTFYSFIAA